MKKLILWSSILFGGVIVFFVVGSFIYDATLTDEERRIRDEKLATEIRIKDSIKQTAEQAQQSVDNANKARGSHSYAFQASKEYVKLKLNNPETADFPFAEYKHLESNEGGWVITSYVEAKNAFGQTQKLNYIAKLKLKNPEKQELYTDWELTSLDLLK